MVRAIEFENLNVAYGSAGSEQTFTFSSAIEIEWDENGALFTQPGDSGALVLTYDDFRPIGLHFAAPDKYRVSYVMPLKRICDIFERRYCKGLPT